MGLLINPYRFASVGGGGSGDYPTEVLADSPLGYWRLGEASGTTMADSSGNGRAGSYVSSPALGATGLIVGDSDTAMRLNTGTPHAKVAAATMPTITGATLTVEAWFKQDATSGTRCVVNRASFAAAPASSTHAFDLMSVNGALRASVHTSSGDYTTLNSAALIVAGQTHHAVLTYDGTTLRSYLDGVEVASIAKTGTLHPGDSVPLTIGIDSAEAYYHFSNGTIDEVAVYDTALSPTRIAAHYAAGT